MEKKIEYKIIIASNGKQISTLFTTSSETEVNDTFSKLVNKNREDIKFPCRFIHNKNKMEKAYYEIIIIKSKQKGDINKTNLRNENGKFVNYSSDDENWIIYDRDYYEAEETFWVYGFDSVSDRKNYQWIYSNYIALNCSKYQVKNVFAFNNKLLISSNCQYKMILCKNHSDCVRLYNSLEYDGIRDKLKFIAWGNDMTNSIFKSTIYKDIAAFTNWPMDKVYRNSLRP